MSVQCYTLQSVKTICTSCSNSWVVVSAIHGPVLVPYTSRPLCCLAKWTSNISLYFVAKHTNTHTHACTHARTHTYTYAHTHIHTHARTHTHTHTDMHACTPILLHGTSHNGSLSSQPHYVCSCQ